MKKIKGLILGILLITCVITVSSCAFLEFLLSDELYTVDFENYNKGEKPKSLEEVIALPDELPVLEEKGYTFLGWYYDENFIIEALPNDLVIEDTILYACWEKEKFSLKFENNGFGDSLGDISNISTIPLLPILEHKGHKFMGWYYDANFTKKAKFGDEIFANTTLYAKWEVLTYEIYYYYGFESCVPYIETVPYDLEFTMDEPKKEGYRFIEWNTKSDGSGTSYKPNQKVKNLASSSIELYAKWEAIDYTLTFVTNNGEKDIVKTLHINDKIDKVDDPIKQGYKFIGWYNGDELFDFKDAYMPTKDITLEARYLKEIKINYISFDTTYDVVSGYASEDITKIVSIPKKEGYTFVGWYLDEGFKQEYNLNTFPNQDINVYAKWEINKYKLTFNLNNGENNVVLEFDYNESLNTINDPIKQGYKFIGWYNDNEVFDFKDAYMPAENLILDAKYLKGVEIVFMSFGEIYEKIIGYETESIETNILNPTRVGYTFAGWYFDEEFKQEFDLKDFPQETIKVYAKWEANKYTINFDLNGATGSIKELSATVDEDIYTPVCNIEYKGYSFVGWNTIADGTGKMYSENENIKNISTTNITLYAIWNQKEYTLTIKPNNGEPDVVRILHYNDIIEMVEDPTKTNYEFVGWYTFDINQIVEFSFDNAKMPDKNLTIFAKYEGEVTVLFLIDNKPFKTIHGFSGEDLVLDFNNPVKDGYTFGGWYLDDDCTVEYNLNTFPNIDTNVFGKLEPNIITINYDGNGQTSGNMSSQAITYGSSTILNKNEFIKIGHNFLGWSTNKDAVVAEFNDQYNKDIISEGEVTLYAVWEKIEYTLTFVLNNGSDDIVSLLCYNETIIEPSNPTKSGYKFIGWYLDDNIFSFDGAKMPDSNVVLYAKYLKGVELTFISLGEIYDKIKGYETEEIMITPTTPTYKGHTFKGWYLDADFITKYELNIYPSENLNVYAKWEENVVTINFNGNGHTSGNMEPQQIKYGSNTSLNKNEYVKDGYKFIGWSTNKNATNVEFVDQYNKDIISEGEITLYAIWNKITYNITFNINNHGEQPASIKGVTSLPSTLPILIEEGYIFVGWYYDSNFTKLASVNEVINSNVTLFAKWEEEKAEPTPTEPIVDDIIYDDFQIHFLELGNDYTGDSTYIKAGDVDILIDAGSRTGSATTIKSYVDQYCTDGVLEYVIATHADQDHIAGFVGNSSGSTRTGILYQYKVKTLIDFAITTKTTQVYNNYVTARTYAINNGATHYTAAQCFNETDGAKAVYELTDNISMKILYNYYYFNKSSDENNFSVCTLFTYNDHNFMFTGDLEEDGEEKLAAYYDGSTSAKTLPEVELFKAGHHGSKTSSNDCLLKLIQPKIVCVCCCAGGSEYTPFYQNTFPTQDMITRVAKYTDRVYVTSVYDEKELTRKSMNGDIIISSNGKTIGVSATNNIIKLKDTTWFNETVYIDSNGKYCSGTGKKDYFTAATSGTKGVPRRVWPS